MDDLRAASDSARHAVRVADGAHEARNPAQAWRTRFDGRGATTEPDAGGWTWGLELARYGFGGAERDVGRPAQVCAAGARLAYAWDAALEEWYVNDARGLEHGFVVRERPAGGEGELVLTLAVRGELAPRVHDDGRGASFFGPAGERVLDYAGLTVLDAEGAPVAARLALAPEGLEIRVDERGARYPLTIDPIAQQAYIKASNTGISDFFGYAVAVSGDTAVVGAYQEDSGATGIDGDQTSNTASNSGAAYVFVRTGATWTQQAYLKASNTDAGDEFGRSVAIAGNTIVVGAWLEDSAATGVNGDQSDDSQAAAGAAYVFVRSGTTWSQQAYLKASNTPFGAFFGFSVAISGNTIVVGSHGERSNATGVNGDQNNILADGSGAAYVFVRSGTTWSQQAYLKASNTGFSDYFGFSVAISGHTVICGAVYEDSDATGIDGFGFNDNAVDSGAAYVFTRTGTTWIQQAFVKASNTGAGDYFGNSVAVSGDTVVVGAPSEDSFASGVNGDESNDFLSGSGAAYVFVRSGATWSQQAYVKASNPGPQDAFGQGVSAAAERIAVGAPFEDSNATGVDGNQMNNLAMNAGAAYLFQRSGSVWSQQAYLKASNSEALDNFGYSVALSGNTLACGAYNEDGGATGIDGDQASNTAGSSGAVYAFDLGSDPIAFCFGDGSGTACPCGNVGAAGNGCPNSVNALGANLAAAGSASVGADTLSLSGTGMPDSSALYFQGTTQQSAGFGSVFGDGLRCAAGSVIRLGTKVNAAGASQFPGGGDPSVSVQGQCAAGDVRTYQAWYRNAASFCTPFTFNLTNGIQLLWGI